MDNNLENAKETGSVETKVESDNTGADARIKALEAQIDKLKNAVTNASADASKWKQTAREKDDALKARMSDEERTKQEQDEAKAALLQRVTELETERNIAHYTASLAANDIGMDADNAKAVAEALNAGEIDKVFEGIRKFIIAHDKALREDAIRNNPTLPSGRTSVAVSKEDFDKMGYREMLELKNTNPELYNEYMNRR